MYDTGDFDKVEQTIRFLLHVDTGGVCPALASTEYRAFRLKCMQQLNSDAIVIDDADKSSRAPVKAFLGHNIVVSFADNVVVVKQMEAGLMGGEHGKQSVSVEKGPDIRHTPGAKIMCGKRKYDVPACTEYQS